MTSHLTSYLPPSPTDHSSPPSRKENNLHINTKQNSHETTGPNTNNTNSFWKDPTSLFSPPLSPLAPTYQDRPISSNANRKKSQQQHGLMSWQQSHWDNVDIDKLTLENAKLKRSNRLLKVDREVWLEKRIRPLDQHIRDLTVANVRWQRAAKLLQQDLIDSQQQLKDYKYKQVTQMPWMGCEYQFLVDMIHQLQTQIAGQTTCKERNSSARIITPIDHTPSRELISNTTNINRQQHGSPMTTPGHLTTVCPEQQKDWDELSVLLDRIRILEHQLDNTLRQLTDKQQNEDRFKAELLTKNQTIELLEKGCDELNNQVQTLRHKLEQDRTTIHQQINPAPLNNELAFIPDQRMMANGFLMMTRDEIETIEDDSATNQHITPDTDDDFDIDCTMDDESFDLDGSSILETARDVDRLLPGDHINKGSVSDGCQEGAATFDKLSCDLSSAASTTLLPSLPSEESSTNYGSSTSTNTATSFMDHTRTLSSSHSSTSTAITGWDHDTCNKRCPMSDKRFSTTSTLFTLDPPLPVSLPGSYPSISKAQSSSLDVANTVQVESMDTIDEKGQEGMLMILPLIMGHEPYAPFVVLTFLLGVSTKMGIKDDWLIPITLLALCSGYLWTGAFRGIHIKVNF